MPENNGNDTPEDIGRDMSDDIVRDIPEDIGEDIPEDVGRDIPENIEKDIPEDIGGDTPENDVLDGLVRADPRAGMDSAKRTCAPRSSENRSVPNSSLASASDLRIGMVLLETELQPAR